MYKCNFRRVMQPNISHLSKTITPMYNLRIKNLKIWKFQEIIFFIIKIIIQLFINSIKIADTCNDPTVTLDCNSRRDNKANDFSMPPTQKYTLSYPIRFLFA